MDDVNTRGSRYGCFDTLKKEITLLFVEQASVQQSSIVILLNTDKSLMKFSRANIEYM